MAAAKNGHYDTVKLLVEHKANPAEKDIFGNTALILASWNGHGDTIALLLGMLGISADNINAGNEQGTTALMMASGNSHSKVVALLLGAGADVNACDEKGTPALMVASLNGHSEVVALLLGAGAYVNAGNWDRRNSLMAAAGNGHCDVVKLLVASGAKLEEEDDTNATALMRASQYGHCDVVKLLLQHNAKTNRLNIDGSTPLIEASHNGHYDVVKLLVQAVVDVNEVSGNGWTALAAAVANGRLGNVVKLLLEAGADVNSGKVNYWSRCVITGQLSNNDFEDQDAEFGVTLSEGCTPLILACEFGHWEVARLLLHAGADDVYSSMLGENALMYITQAMLPRVCQRQQKVIKELQQKMLSVQRCSHILHVSAFGTTPFSDILMNSLVYNQSLSQEILLEDTAPHNAMEGYLYGILPDGFFNNKKSVISVLPAPYSGIEGKIALHTVGTAFACKAPMLMVTQNRTRLMNMLMQTPLHLLAMEHHYITRTWMTERISVMIQQGYSFSDCDINGRTCYHMACIFRNAQFLLCAATFDPDITHNMNIRDNVAQRAIDYILEYWKNSSRSSLVHLCSVMVGKGVLQHLGEFSQQTPVPCMYSTWDKGVLAKHFVHDMRAKRLVSVKHRFTDSVFPSSSIKQMFQDRTTGVVRLNDKAQEQLVITVLGLLHCIGLEMQKCDELFECIPALKGSILEYTKCGVLNELDLSMKLVCFTDQFKLDLTDTKYVGLQGKVEKKPTCSYQGNFHSVQFCCKFWLHFLQAIHGYSVKQFLCQNSITIESCHRKHGFTGTMYVMCESFGNLSRRKSEPICIAVDMTPAIQIKDYMCLLHVRHYDNKQAEHFFPTRLELSSSQKDWDLLKHVPQEVLYGYTMVKLLRSLPKTCQSSESGKRTFTVDDILPSYMVKSSLLWVLDPDDKFRKEYKWICKDDIFQSEARSAYNDDVFHLCQNLIDHSMSCNVVELKHNNTIISCLSKDDVTQLQDIADKCIESHPHLTGRDRILPYVLMTQWNAAHHSVQNGINEEQLMEKVYKTLASQGIPQLNTDDDVIYNRVYYSEDEKHVIPGKNNGGCSEKRKGGVLKEDLGQEGEYYPDISLEMSRKCRLWALRALRLIVLFLKSEVEMKNYYLPRQKVLSRDVDLTVELCEVFIALLE